MNSWLVNFDARQRGLIANMRAYVQGNPSGLPGHQIMLICSKLADMMDSCGESLDATTILQVPFISQWVEEADRYDSDCGPACVCMVGDYFAPELAEEILVNDVMGWITHGADRGTYIIELQEASKHYYDVALMRYNGSSWDRLKELVTKGVPVIVLGDYSKNVLRMDWNFRGGHYFVVVGFTTKMVQGVEVEVVVVHDPDFYRMGGVDLSTVGAFVHMDKELFMSIWDSAPVGSGNPKRMMLVPSPVNNG